jgi:hypothetical protein
MRHTSKALKRAKLPAVPWVLPAKGTLTAALVEKELRSEGFKPTDAQTKRWLRANGFLGMPEE